MEDDDGTSSKQANEGDVGKDEQEASSKDLDQV